MKKVLIAGVTGYLGKFVLHEFKKQGYWVRALVRNSTKLDSLNGYYKDIDEVFIGEVTNPSSIKEVCKDIDIVFSSVGITKQKDNLTYMDVDYQANKNLLEEAVKEGVSKFIYISVFNAGKLNHLKGIEAKLRFEKELKESGLDHSIIYPNGFFSDMLEYINMAQSGRGYVFGSGEYRINPIHGQDLAQVCVTAATEKTRSISVGGPDTVTHNEILKMAFKAFDKNEKISKIPIWLRNLLLVVLRTCTSVKIYGPLEFFMTVLAVDMVAPEYGTRHLKDFFLESANNASDSMI